MTDWIEILKSFIYNGELTYGFTIWIVVALMAVGAFILYLRNEFRGAMGLRRLKRLVFSKLSLGMRVKFELRGDVDDIVLFNTIGKSIMDGVAEHDKSIDLKVE